MRLPFAFSTIVVLFTLSAMGCGGSGPVTGKLKGRVTLDGKPIEVGLIQVYSEDGKNSSSGPIGKEGIYEIAVTVHRVQKLAQLFGV